MIKSIFMKNLLLGLCVFSGMHMIAMEYSEEENQRRIIVKALEYVGRYREFLQDKIDQYKEKMNKAVTGEDRNGYREVLNDWIKERDAFENAIRVHGNQNVGEDLEDHYNSWGTFNKRFFNPTKNPLDFESGDES